MSTRTTTSSVTARMSADAARCILTIGRSNFDPYDTLSDVEWEQLLALCAIATDGNFAIDGGGPGAVAVRDAR